MVASNQVNNQEATMKKLIFGILIATTLIGGTMAWADDISRDVRDIRQDRRDVWRDSRDIRQDRTNIWNDRRQLRQDIHAGRGNAVAADRAMLRGDRRDLRHDRRDLRRDRWDLRRDRADLRRDLRWRR